MAVLSIEAESVEKFTFGKPKRKVTKEEIAAVASACARLLEQLGPLAKCVEVIKVVPWHAYGKANIFDVKAVLSLTRDDSQKVEAKRTFEAHNPSNRPQNGWDLEELQATIVTAMDREIRGAVRNKILNVTDLLERLKKLLD